MPSAAQISALLAEVRHTLTTLSGKGCAGFDAAPESLEKVLCWGRAPAPGEPTGPQEGPGSSAMGIGKDLPAVRSRLGDCRRCGLAQARRHIVFGGGSANARLVFVGEGPGRDEDMSGEPLVGPAGG